MMRKIFYICALTAYGFVITNNLKAQKAEVSDMATTIDGIRNVKPGETLKPENTANWTEEMHMQWEDAVKKANDEIVPPVERPVIETPDFSNMTDRQMATWKDSVINVLYPKLKIFTYDKSTGKTILSEETGMIDHSAVETRMGYTNSSIPNTASINTNTVVGEIAYSSSLLLNGALTYSVPVDIYPGINGTQPNISINYNSLAGNGVMGVGWNIGGLSSITRTSKSIYYDNKTEGVRMDKNDPFMLDGMRMIRKSETTSQIDYETERGIIKVSAYLLNGIIRYFKVMYPNGSVGTYGDVNNINTAYLSYPLAQLTDRFGNTITYTYGYWDNHHTLTGIHYGNASLQFNYETLSRSDNPFYYQGGLKVTEQRLLTSIDCKYGSYVLRNYGFSYTAHKSQMALSQITLLSGGVYINPLKFYYGQDNNAYIYSTSQTRLLGGYEFTTPGQVRATRGKFDYGTEDDGVIVVPHYPYYYNEKQDPGLFQHSRNRYSILYDGTEKIFLYTGLNSSDALPMQNLTTEEGFIDILCANLDGKGEDEVIKINNTRSGNTYEQISFKVYQGDRENGLVPKYTRQFQFSTVVEDHDNGFSIHPKFYYTGDFNGDGKMEVLAVSCDKPAGKDNITSKCYLFDLESGVKLFESYVFPYVVEFFGNKQSNEAVAAHNTDRLFTIDYDGDGKSDICLINSTGTHVYTFDVSGSSYSMRKVAEYLGITKGFLVGKQILPGDFNGDGKTDILVSPVRDQADYTWTTYYSKGDGQFDRKSFTAARIYENDRPYIQDINNDGLSDLLVFRESGFNSYLMKPNGLAEADSYTTYNSNSINAVVVPIDINSSNYFGRLVCVKSGVATKYAYPRNDTKEKLLTGVINSFGVIEKNHYQKLNETSSYGGIFYNKGSGAVYPYLNAQGPLNVPVSREQYYKNQLYSDVNFSYENAVVHNQGLGFCGFSKITSEDNIRGRYTIQTYDPYRFGLLVSDDNLTSKTTNSYSVSVQPDKITKITLTNQTVQDKVKGITQTIGYIYDSYGNPTNQTINFGDNITQTTSNTYYNNTGTPYILGALTDQTVTVSRNGATNSSRMQVSSHNYGIPLTKITYANGNKTSETSYAYNPQGCLIQESAKPYTSPNTLTNRVEYDGYGRIIKETDPTGIYTTYEYNTSTGMLAAVKNHKSQATTFSYDNLWRRTGTLFPDGVNESISYTWSSGAGLFAITSTTTGQPVITTYLDAFGREVRTSSVRYNGTVIHTDKTYDSYGRLYRESLPFTGSNASYWNTTTFDNYDRPIAIAYASGKRNTYSYSGKNVTTVNNGISTTYNYDGQGNLTSVMDPAGIITYNLRPDGQPTSIVAPGNTTTSFSYDGYGRQTGISDPSAGSRTFAYDAAGYLQRETDANNKSKTMSYDRYGRITSKALPEVITNYGYNSDGLLDSETSTNATSRIYTYDTYGRLQKDRDDGPDGKWLEKTYTYSGGNVQTVQFTSHSGFIGTESYTYSNGHLSEIKIGSTSVWKLNGENALGIPVSVLTGPVTRTYSYNAYGMPTGRSAYSNTGGTFQNYSYSFDSSKGNLTYRKDNGRNKQENFGYDNLNRLTSYAGNSVGYDVKGNVTSKSDIGNTFYYNTANKPYAVSGVDAGTNIALPQRSQLITYTSFERPASLSENDCTATFTYDGSGSRKKMQLAKNGSNQLLRLRYYLGSRYEADHSASSIKEMLYLGGDAYSAPAVYVTTGSSWVLYYICRDHLGSITHLVNSNGTVAYEYSYDAWGRLRNPADQAAYPAGSEPELFLGRGYTGHEHLPMFGLINMNARLYDPAIGRFLSPDPYVQSPDFSQNFNRYSYCLNNPLVYTDPSGEFLGLAAASLYFVGDLLANLVTGTSHPFETAWNNASTMYNGMSNVLQFPIYTDDKTQVTGGLDPFALGVSLKGAYSPNNGQTVFGGSVGYGLLGGFNANGGFSQQFGDFSIGVGIGGGKNYWGWNASATVDGYGAGYGKTYYGNAIGPDRISNAQIVGNVSVLWKGGSFTLQNDVKLLGDGEDRWRTNAFELTFGNISVGNYIYTNYGAKYGGVQNESLLSPIWGANRNDGFSAWSDGRVYSAPLWIGIRTGNTMQRVGYSFHEIQDFTQNFVHGRTGFGHQNYYLNYQYFRTGMYLHSGYYNPFSLWGY